MRLLRLLHPRACPRPLCVPHLTLLIMLAGLVVVSLIVTAYAFWLAATNQGNVDKAKMDAFGRMTGEHFGPVVNLVLTALAGRWLAAERSLDYGPSACLALLVGATGAGIGWGFGYPPDAADAAFTLVLVVAAMLGTWLGRRERTEAATRTVLLDSFARATTPAELATRIATALGPDAAVDLYADANAPRFLAGSDPSPPPAPPALLRCEGNHAVALRSGPPPRRLLAWLPTIGICLQRLALRAEGERAGARAERERLAGDIHDTIAQSLAGVTTHLEAANSALPARPGDAGQHLTAATASARTALAELRGLVWALRPAGGRASLVEAMERSCELVAMESGIEVVLDVIHELPPELLPEVELCLLRAAQEGMRNAVRHGDARRIDVVLQRNTGGIGLLVDDDGSGFAASRIPDAEGGHGLAAMRARVQALGGTMEIATGPARGTCLVIHVPFLKGEVGR